MCSYCGEAIGEQGQSKSDLAKTLLKIAEQYGSEILEDIPRLNALLMDYTPDMTRERKLIINALKEGVLAYIIRSIDAEHTIEVVSRKSISFLLSEMWITEVAAQYVVNVLLQYLGYGVPAQNGESEGESVAEIEKDQNRQLIKGDVSFDGVVKKEDLLEYSSIGYKAFASNHQIRDIDIPDNIKRIYSKAFLDCSALSRVQLGKGVEAIGNGAFDGCVSLTEIIAIDNPYYTVNNGLLIDKKNRRLMKCISNGRRLVNISNGIKTVNRRAFEGSSVEEIVVPRTVESIEEDAFYMTMSLQSISVEASNTLFRTVDGVLHSRNVRVLLRYPQGKNDPSYYFEDEVIDIGKKAFSCVANLIAVTFNSKLQTIRENAFEYCTGIENLVFPRSVETIGERAFQYCQGLKSIMLPQGIVSIGDCAFLGCESLQVVSVPRSVKEIGHMAFAGCKSLKRVVLQENVSFIGNKAFFDCPEVELEIKGNEYVATYCNIHGIKSVVG